MPTQFLDALPVRSTNQDHFIGLFANDLTANPGRWAVYPLDLSRWQLQAERAAINSGSHPLFGEGFRATARQGRLYVQRIA